jgi:fibronectin-binding autotransporter adhesin
MIEALESRIAPATIFWTGSSSNLWSGSGNWAVDFAGTIPTTISPGDTLIFADNAVSMVSSNDTTPATPYSIVIDASTSYTLAGTAVTLLAAGVVKSGTGTATVSMVLLGTGGVHANGGKLVLSGTNTHTGGNTIDSGTLEVANDQNLGATGGGISISNGGTLSATDSFSNIRPIAIGVSANISVSVNDVVSLNGVISNAAGTSGVLTSTGAGTLELRAANTYSGGTKISSGTLKVSANNNLGALAGDVTMQPGSTIEFVNGFTTARNFALAGTDTFVIPSGKTVTINGVVTDSATAPGSIVVAGGGILLLGNSANTYSGAYTMPAGTVKLNGTTTTLSGGGTVSIAMVPGTGDIASIVLAGTTQTSKLVINGPATTSVFSISIPDANDHIDTITLGKDVQFGDGNIDSTPDLFIAGKANAIVFSDVSRGAILKFGDGLPYDVSTDNTTPDTYNNHPDITLRDVLGSDVIIDVTGDGTPGGVGGGGLGKFVVRSWGFPGLVKTTQSIDTFTIKRGDSFAVLEVDKFNNGVLTPANVNKITCLAGKWNSAGTAIEGYVDKFDVGGFANGATLTAGYVQTRVLISGNYLEPGNIAMGGTITLTSESPSALVDIRVGTFKGTVDVAGTIASFVCTGNFSGELIADGIVTKVQALKFVDDGIDNARITTRIGDIGAVVATAGGMTNTVIQSAGNIGPVTLTGSGATRSMIGSVVAAFGNIGIVKIGSSGSGASLSASLVLSGVNLGADGAVGGAGLDLDVYSPSVKSIGDIFIYGTMSSSIIAASIDPADGIFGNIGDLAVAGSGGTIGKVSLNSAAFTGKNFLNPAPGAHTNAVLGGSINGVYQIGVGAAKIAAITSTSRDIRSGVGESPTDLLFRAF